MRRFENFTLNEIVKADFRAATVFDELGIDLPAHHKNTIEEVCMRYQINSELILDKIIEKMEVKMPIPGDFVNSF